MCSHRGLWNVPYITQVYLIKGSILRSKLSQVSLFLDEDMDPDMVFCRTIRDQVSCWCGHVIDSRENLKTDFVCVCSCRAFSCLCPTEMSLAVW